MAFLVSRIAALACAAVLAGTPMVASAQSQSGDAKGNEAKTNEARAAAQRKIEANVEAARTMTGPAASPECVWFGTRVIGLLWNDDTDTAIRQLQLYDRFNCPGQHVQLAFRCVVRQATADPKAADDIKTLEKDCWINPGSSPPAPATAATNPPPAAHPGTSNR